MEKENNTQPHPQKHSLGARIMAGLGFSLFGAKISLLGTVMDAGNIVGPELSFGEKLRGVFSKSFLEKFNEKIVSLVEVEGKTHSQVQFEAVKASFKVMKWTMILGAVGTVVGFAVGWVQGGKIENWKDIFKHPWRSTKIIFGFEKPPQQQEPKPEIKEPLPTVETQVGTQASTKQWTEGKAKATSHQETLAQEKSLEPSLSIG